MWSEEGYWLKGRLYISRAQTADPDEGLYAFWMSLAMEFVARAALSKVSPVLNADPQRVENIYFALGLGEVGSPKTVPLHAVYTRCVRVVEGFEDHNRKFCDFLGVQRNEELHTGSLVFEDLKLQGWLQKYYEVLDILCRHLEHDLDDILGPEEGEAAREILKASTKGLETSVKQLIADHRRAFDGKPEEERQQLVGQASFRSMAYTQTELSNVVGCPACSSRGLITGRPIRRSKPYYEEDRLLEDVTCLSESFSCFACELSLQSASQLQWSAIEPQFTVVLETSLHEHQEFEYYVID